LKKPALLRNPARLAISTRVAARVLCGMAFLCGALTAQAPSEALPSTATMKQLMLDLIHPSSNDILLVIYRGGPKDEKDWAAVRRGAVTLAESANMLMMPGRVRDQGNWRTDAKLLADAGAAAYKAAQAKDANALAAVAEPLDVSCTTCHKHYRPNVFPGITRAESSPQRRGGGSK
jgi:cytochrome c556